MKLHAAILWNVLYAFHQYVYYRAPRYSASSSCSASFTLPVIGKQRLSSTLHLSKVAKATFQWRHEALIQPRGNVAQYSSSIIAAAPMPHDVLTWSISHYASQYFTSEMRSYWRCRPLRSSWRLAKCHKPCDTDHEEPLAWPWNEETSALANRNAKACFSSRATEILHRGLWHGRSHRNWPV